MKKEVPRLKKEISALKARLARLEKERHEISKGFSRDIGYLIRTTLGAVDIVLLESYQDVNGDHKMYLNLAKANLLLLDEILLGLEKDFKIRKTDNEKIRKRLRELEAGTTINEKESGDTVLRKLPFDVEIGEG